jgi:hypothetical protein
VSFVGAFDCKSLLTIAKLKRVRCKAHLKFVVPQPCLVSDSRFLSAAVITGNCIKPAMRRPTGNISISARNRGKQFRFFFGMMWPISISFRRGRSLSPNNYVATQIFCYAKPRRQ